MDDFIRPSRRPSPLQQGNTQPAMPPKVAQEPPLEPEVPEDVIDEGAGPIERPTLFTKDEQDKQSAPMINAESIADEEAAAASEAAAGATPPEKKRRFARKHIAVIVTIVIALIGAGTAYFVMNRSNTPEETATNQQPTDKMTAVASAVEGTVEFKRGEDDWKELTEDSDLQNADQIRTKDDSRAAITFGDDSVIRLNASTRVTITALANERIVISDDAGQVYARVAQSKEYKDRTFGIEINDDLISAKGTAFKTFNTIDTTGVEVYHNSVEVKDTDVKQGEAYYIDTPDAAKKGKTTPIDIEQLKNDEFIAWCIGQDKDDDTFKDQLGFLGDFDGPDLTIDSPKDGDVVKVTDSSNIGAATISGKTEKAAKVTIVAKAANGTNSAAVEANVDAVGGFTSGLVSAPIGKVTYEVTARDANGNKTVKTITIEYKVEATATPTPTPSEGPVSILSTSFVGGGIKVNWQVKDGADIDGGFRVVWDTDSKPTYPDDESEYAGRDSRIYVIPADKVEDGKTYHIRVCVMKDGACADTSYSNEVTAVAPNE